ncbi:MAG: ribonuclease P protein component [Synergistaceae bacterium]|nr:ribonuclease P protein component [Synergistaceae bacterium]
MSDIIRLRKGWEFDLIFRTGVRINGDLVRLLYLKEDALDIKFGCAVGKRLGKAHVRNRGRRILRAAFVQFEKKLIPGLRIVLTLKEDGLDAKTQDIAEELEKLFRRKKLFAAQKI